MRILHLIDRLTLGGPLFATTGLVKNSRAAPGGSHRLVSLLRGDRRAIEIAQQAGIEVVSAPSHCAVDTLIAQADIVQVHFWNSPAIHGLLNRNLPACRLLVWCHVNGAHPPHVIPVALARQAARVATTTAMTLDLPQFQALRREAPSRLVAIPGGADFSRLDGFQPQPHDGFRIGFVGRVEASKVHPDFVAMCARATVPSLRVVVRGDGDYKLQLQRQATALGIRNRFSFQAHAEDIRDALADLDVLGYPLHPETFCTSELVVQEAMYAGIPCVLLAHGGPARLVTNGRNGIVAATTDEYVAAIESLARRPEWRQQLGRQASADARSTLGAPVTSIRMDAVYDELGQLSKKELAPLANVLALGDAPPGTTGAQALVASLDGLGDSDLRLSLLEGNDNAALDAEQRLASCGPSMQDVILQYRLFYPDDRWLRLWSGLALASRKRWALAAGELLMARQLGCGGRADRHMARMRREEARHA